MTSADVTLYAVGGIPMVGPGDDVGMLILDALAARAHRLVAGDIVVVASTIVSKAEDRFFDLTLVEPSDRAQELASVTGKDPRLVEMALRESIAVSRATPGVLIVRNRLGFVSANAGIDFSNVGRGPDVGLLLPLDPDRSAARIRERLQSSGTEPIGVIVSDTHGRAFRKGNVNVAIGVAGVAPIVDERGKPDLFGRTLEATVVPLADQIAGAAALITGEAAEGLPVVIVRGVEAGASGAGAGELNWPAESDLFA